MRRKSQLPGVALYKGADSIGHGFGPLTFPGMQKRCLEVCVGRILQAGAEDHVRSKNEGADSGTYGGLLVAPWSCQGCQTACLCTPSWRKRVKPLLSLSHDLAGFSIIFSIMQT